ncbi:MAG: DNRLRE domain-containing protein [Pseudomonadota bacterium]
MKKKVIVSVFLTAALLSVSVFQTLVASTLSAADRWNWTEGSESGLDGATREFYNAAASLRWQHPNGDWRDKLGTPQGKSAFSELTIAGGKEELPVSIDITALANQWLNGSLANRGVMLQIGNVNGGVIRFASRENPNANLRPRLVLHFRDGKETLNAVADTSLDPSSYKSNGKSILLSVGTGMRRALLQFDFSALTARQAALQKAELQLVAIERFGASSAVQIFAVDLPVTAPITAQLGIASQFVGDVNIAHHPDVVYATGFDDKNWIASWHEFIGHFKIVDSADHFSPLSGSALQVRLEKGDNNGAGGNLMFKKLLGSEPEQMYVRYYLRLGNNWRPRIDGGKLPGFAGTYGKGGWGGRPNDGRSGWSARGAFLKQIAEGNPLAGRTPIGSYVYENGKSNDFGAVFAWSEGEGAYLENNRWYCIEQYLRLNTPGQSDGVLQAWLDGKLVLNRNNLNLRLVPELKIEKFWISIYHGGSLAI